MPNGRFRRYYWQIRTLLSERAHLLDVKHPAHHICEEYEVEYAGIFRASIVFEDGSRLVVRFSLKDDDNIKEYDYAYQYLGPQGRQILRYDDAPHHPEISTWLTDKFNIRAKVTSSQAPSGRQSAFLRAK